MPTNPFHSMFMSKPGSVDDFTLTEILDHCDPYMGMPSTIPDPHFDWASYYESCGDS